MQLVLLPFIVGTLATPAGSTVTGTASAANDRSTGADCEEPIAAEHGYGRAIEKPVQWMTLQELRDELERTRSVWDSGLDVDVVLRAGQLPRLGEKRSVTRWSRTSCCGDRATADRALGDG